MANTTGMSQSLWNRAGSFDDEMLAVMNHFYCLNPFRAGQGLSTFRTGKFNSIFRSQSLSSRAGSFDGANTYKLFENEVSQSLSSRAGSFD